MDCCIAQPPPAMRTGTKTADAACNRVVILSRRVRSGFGDPRTFGGVNFGLEHPPSIRLSVLEFQARFNRPRGLEAMIADTLAPGVSWSILARGFSQEVIEGLEPRKSCLLLRNLFPARCAGGFCCGETGSTDCTSVAAYSQFSRLGHPSASIFAGSDCRWSREKVASCSGTSSRLVLLNFCLYEKSASTDALCSPVIHLFRA